MSTIPYDYRKYLDDVTKMRQRGHITAGEQIASPSSAGSRGLSKVDNFIKSPNQLMKDNDKIRYVKDCVIPYSKISTIHSFNSDETNL